MITPDDIRKSTNVSGYAHVGLVAGPSRGDSPPYYQAYEGGGRGGDWKGPARATAEEAAQDYCDRANGGLIKPPSDPKGRGGVRLAGHKFDVEPDPIPTDIEAAYGMIRDFKAQQAGKQGYVYLIVEDVPGAMFGKVGYSVNPQKRVAELQTGNPRPLKLYASKLGTLEDEIAIHRRHIDNNVLQEWFRLTPPLLSEFPADDKEDA